MRVQACKGVCVEEGEGRVNVYLSIHLPMCLVLLTTQMFFPNVGTQHLLSISKTPRGVAGMSVGSPEQYLPEEEE